MCFIVALPEHGTYETEFVERSVSREVFVALLSKISSIAVSKHVEKYYSYDVKKIHGVDFVETGIVKYLDKYGRLFAKLVTNFKISYPSRIATDIIQVLYLYPSKQLLDIIIEAFQDKTRLP